MHPYGGGGGSGNPPAPPLVASVQVCAGPPVRAGDPDLFPSDSQPKTKPRAEIGARFNVKMTNWDMSWDSCTLQRGHGNTSCHKNWPNHPRYPELCN